MRHTRVSQWELLDETFYAARRTGGLKHDRIVVPHRRCEFRVLCIFLNHVFPGLIAVSYTHLDVYKRQALMRVARRRTCAWDSSPEIYNTVPLAFR